MFIKLFQGIEKKWGHEETKWNYPANDYGNSGCLVVSWMFAEGYPYLSSQSSISHQAPAVSVRLRQLSEKLVSRFKLDFWAPLTTDLSYAVDELFSISFLM